MNGSLFGVSVSATMADEACFEPFVFAFDGAASDSGTFNVSFTHLGLENVCKLCRRLCYSPCVLGSVVGQRVSWQ